MAPLALASSLIVLGYRGTGKDPHTIGEELDVETIMEGEVQHSDGRLHVNIQLIDARTNIFGPRLMTAS